MTDHTVTLTPAKQADGSIQWTMDYEGKKGNSPSTYPIIDLKAKEAHTLTYTIANPTGLTINFDPSMVNDSSGKSIHNALWVQATTKPPQAMLSDQIKKVDIKSPTELKFKDSNSGDPMTLVYQINFVDASNSGAKVTALDPDLKNGGGNTTAYQNYAVLIAVVGAVLIAVLLFRRFTQRSRQQANPTL
jgi:hypothetical protein